MDNLEARIRTLEDQMKLVHRVVPETLVGVPRLSKVHFHTAEPYTVEDGTLWYDSDGADTSSVAVHAWDNSTSQTEISIDSTTWTTARSISLTVSVSCLVLLLFDAHAKVKNAGNRCEIRFYEDTTGLGIAKSTESVVYEPIYLHWPIAAAAGTHNYYLKYHRSTASGYVYLDEMNFSAIGFTV